jgi:hypothetical protein
LVTPFSDPDDDDGLAIAAARAIRPDGKILVAGRVGLQARDYALARYHADGRLDESCGPDGTGLIRTDVSGGDDEIRAM